MALELVTSTKSPWDSFLLAEQFVINISMSAFCVHVKDDTPLFKPHYQLPHYAERLHQDVSIDVINPYWIDRVESGGLQVLRVELFYAPPGLDYVMGIHTDSGMGDRSKINWVFGGEGSLMHWYRVVNPKQKEQLVTPVGSQYNLYEPDEIKLMHSTTIQNPAIVQIGVPHNITNPGQERWCYSMVITDPATGSNATFGSVKRIFTNN